MLHGGASALVGRGISILVGAISLPLTIRYLGKLEYGVWVTISSTVVMLNVLDLGIANTLTNLISEAYAREDRERARTYFATALWMTLALAALMAIIATVAWAFIDWGSVMHLSDPQLIQRTRIAILISVLFFCLSMPLSLANRVLAGYQQVHISNYFSIASNVFSLAAILIAMLFHGNLVMLMVSYCVSLLLGNLVMNIWLLGFNKPWMRPSPRYGSRSVLRSLFRQGSLFFVLQLCGVVVYNSDNIVITHFLGPAQVTPYSIAWRLAGYAAMLQQILIPSFWPAFTEAYEKQEMTWLSRVYHGMERKTLLAVTAAALFIGLVGRPFIRFWAGPAAVPPLGLLWTMAAWAVLVSITTNQALLLTATGRLRVEAGAAVAAAVVNLALSIVLVQRMGPEGVILSTIVSFLVCMLLPQAREVHRVLRGDFLRPATGVGEQASVGQGD